MNKYYLVCYVNMTTPRGQIITRVLLSNVEPVRFFKSMDVDCYPMAISELTKTQFNEMKESFPTIRVIDNESK